MNINLVAAELLVVPGYQFLETMQNDDGGIQAAFRQLAYELAGILTRPLPRGFHDRVRPSEAPSGDNSGINGASVNGLGAIVIGIAARTATPCRYTLITRFAELAGLWPAAKTRQNFSSVSFLAPPASLHHSDSLPPRTAGGARLGERSADSRDRQSNGVRQRIR